MYVITMVLPQVCVLNGGPSLVKSRKPVKVQELYIRITLGAHFKSLEVTVQGQVIKT